ncbi:AraC family transcriptional regulator [Klebsiella pneumoniae]|uniref:AraC family transcriptional regulator n=2 Tax=Pseudomonadota TaxID=1224 RepID=A0A157ST99_9BORD|nr:MULTISPECIES: AraC family transcriptional regulator [Pseudomonadota]EKW9968566.1 AraC family transcriptional regulator [Pluralibacter gergoviae]EMC2288997.1 AraC family transcriptional regulator [Salmonella enterica]HEM6677834.1 AraC family transcriptional regulator [Citrobacter amalonaticus]MCY0067412.1 AraC family transcriptional regulator [Klebsiella pneumoniae]SAI73565.1 AraC family transcriptional regulator [Bordetella ansorpii]
MDADLETMTSRPDCAGQCSDTQAFWRDPALPFVESRRACQSRACYKPHHHPTFSIGAVDGGTSVFTGAADGPVLLSPGTLVFVPASRVHACNPAPDTAWSYQMLHLDAAWLQAVRREYARTDAMDDEPVRIVTDPAVYAHFCRLNVLLFKEGDPIEKEAALIEFVGDYDTEQGLSIKGPTVPSNLAERIRPALDCLCASPTATTTLEKLADLAGMSRYQVIRAFRAVTGMTPHAWQLNQRVNLAREWIRSGDSLADVAQHLGFADQAHFQRVFKAHAGVTPGRFRA